MNVATAMAKKKTTKRNAIVFVETNVSQTLLFFIHFTLDCEVNSKDRKEQIKSLKKQHINSFGGKT